MGLSMNCVWCGKSNHVGQGSASPLWSALAFFDCYECGRRNYLVSEKCEDKEVSESVLKMGAHIVDMREVWCVSKTSVRNKFGQTLGEGITLHHKKGKEVFIETHSEEVKEAIFEAMAEAMNAKGI